ncbi:MULTISPECIES: stalk domain-containing protein [Brevibacillus]
MTVNNKKLNDLILVENDVTYVPLRDLADALGATLQWDD